MVGNLHHFTTRHWAVPKVWYCRNVSEPLVSLYGDNRVRLGRRPNGVANVWRWKCAVTLCHPVRTAAGHRGRGARRQRTFVTTLLCAINVYDDAVRAAPPFVFRAYVGGRGSGPTRNSRRTLRTAKEGEGGRIKTEETTGVNDSKFRSHGGHHVCACATPADLVSSTRPDTHTFAESPRRTCAAETTLSRFEIRLRCDKRFFRLFAHNRSVCRRRRCYGRHHRSGTLSPRRAARTPRKTPQ